MIPDLISRYYSHLEEFMKLLPSLLIITILTMGTAALSAEENPVVKVTRLSDLIYLLTTDQGAYTTNAIASVGDDGVLLVDTQSADEAEELKSTVEAFGKGTPKYIINTHRHVEHIGGNAIFGDTPVVIAHELLPSKLRRGSFLFEEYPDATFPDITLSDSISLFFNGEKIRIIALGGSHDDNEIIIHFTGSKIVHLSSVVNGFNFPSIDADGDVFKFPEIVDKAMKLLPEDVVIVSGHNDPGTWAELKPYLDMLISTIDVIKKGLSSGKDLETLQEEKVLDEWKSYAGSYVSVDGWIGYIVDGFEKKDRPIKKNIYEPIYYAMKDGGIETGIERYFEIKNQYSDEYEITGLELLIIGNKLLGKKKIAEAIRFLELSLEESPTGTYAYYAYYNLATAYKEQGKKKSAIRNCEKSLELNPEFQGAATLLEDLKKM
jgi:glyoxylase-like metal-dependent hydrolase (beta-lactamase superfamily II)